MLFLVQCGIPFNIAMPSFASVSGIDQLVLSCCSHVANVVGPKVMVLEGHVGCPVISGSCMRLDVGPALIFLVNSASLSKSSLLSVTKVGCLMMVPFASGPFYHLFQWVIPVSFISFFGCGVLPDDVG